MEKDTVFHKIIRREIPAEIVFENDRLIAFNDIAPAAPTHILVVPKVDIASCNDFESQHQELLGELLLTAKQIAADKGLSEKGYRLVFNCGADGGQTVDQLHLHIIGGRELGWPPG